MSKVQVTFSFRQDLLPLREATITCMNAANADKLARELIWVFNGHTYEEGEFLLRHDRPRVTFEDGLRTFYVTVEFVPPAEAPDPEELKALKEFAAHHGTQWKNVLKREWARGGTVGTLRAIRNNRGPVWLSRFKLPKEGV